MPAATEGYGLLWTAAGPLRIIFSRRRHARGDPRRRVLATGTGIGLFSLSLLLSLSFTASKLVTTELTTYCLSVAEVRDDY